MDTSYSSDNRKLKYIQKLRTRDVPGSQKKTVAQLVTQKDVHGTQIRYPIKTGINFIGSAEDVDVLLQVPGVSAFHAFIEVAEDGEEHFVEDLSSTNGTHIGPHDYQLGDWKLYQLVDGKQISFGPVQCTYEYIGVKAAGLGELETQQTQLLESTEPQLNMNDNLPFCSPVMIQGKIKTGLDLPSDIERDDQESRPSSPNMGPSADANDFLENTGVSVPFYAHQDPELRPPADGGLVGSMDIRIPGSMDLRPKKLTLEFSQAETIVEEGNEAPVVDQNSACEPMQIEEEPDSFAQANQAKEPEDAAPEEVSYTADSMDAESDDFAFPPQADGFDAPEETPLEAACLNETVSLTNPSVESLPKNPEVAKAKDVESSTSSVPITSKGKKNKLKAKRDTKKVQDPESEEPVSKAPKNFRFEIPDMDDDVFATQKEDDPMDAACESPAAIAIQPFIEELEKSATSQRIARSKMQHKGKDESPTLKRSIHKIMMESGSEDESQPKKSEELMTAIVNETIKRRRTLEEQQNALIPDEDTMQRQVTEVLVPLPAPPPLPNTGSVATEASEMETEPMIASALVKKKFGRPPKKAVGAVAPIESPENSDDDTTQDMDSGRELGEKASTNSKKKPAAPKKKAATKAATKKKAPSKSRDLEAKAKTVSTSEMDVDIAETSTSNGGRSKRKAACKAMEATQKMMTVLPALERDFDIQEAPQYLHASRQTPKKAEFEGEALENQEANVGSEDELVAKEVSIPKSCSKESREDPSADASLDAPPETEEISGPAAKSRKRTIGLGRPKSGSSVVKEKSTGDEPAGDDGEPEKGLKESRGRGTTKRKSVTFDKGPLEEVDTTEDPLQVNENALLSSKNTKAPTTYKKRLLAQRATISHTTKDAGDKIDGTSDVAGGPSGVEESEGAKKEISEPEAEVGSKVKVNKKTEKLKLPLSEQETMDNGLSERRKQTVKVMFTGGRDIAMEKKIKKLGGTVVDDYTVCTHVITDKVRRTVKFLCALTSGKCILSPKWVDASIKEGSFIDETAYLLKDLQAEKVHNFSLAKALEHARTAKTRLMDGLRVYATTSVLPPADDLSVVLSAAGADLVREIPDEMPASPNSIVIIGNPADKDEIKSLSDRGYNIQSVEFILRGVLQQKVDYKSHLLPSVHGSGARKH